MDYTKLPRNKKEALDMVMSLEFRPLTAQEYYCEYSGIEKYDKAEIASNGSIQILRYGIKFDFITIVDINDEKDVEFKTFELSKVITKKMIRPANKNDNNGMYWPMSDNEKDFLHKVTGITIA